MKGFISGAVAMVLALATVQPASAMPAANSGAVKDATSPVTQVAWRGRGGHGVRVGRGGFRGVHRGFGGRHYGYRGYRGGYPGYGYGYGYHRDSGGAVAAGIIGLAAGAIAGGALAQSRARGSVGYCESRFRSYSPATGTYLGYDGLRHACP